MKPPHLHPAEKILADLKGILLSLQVTDRDQPTTYSPSMDREEWFGKCRYGSCVTALERIYPTPHMRGCVQVSLVQAQSRGEQKDQQKGFIADS